MELSPEQLLDLIIKAYEKGQKTGISRLATALEDFKHEFYLYKDETTKNLKELSGYIGELAGSLGTLKRELEELRESYRRISYGYGKVVSSVNDLNKVITSELLTYILQLKMVLEKLEKDFDSQLQTVIKEQLSNIPTPHEAPKTSEGESSSPDEDKDLVDIVINKFFPDVRGRIPMRMVQMALYVYSQGGKVPLADLVYRFGTVAYNIYRTKAAAKLFVTKVEGGAKVVEINPKIKGELDKILSQYRR